MLNSMFRYLLPVNSMKRSHLLIKIQNVNNSTNCNGYLPQSNVFQSYPPFENISTNNVIIYCFKPYLGVYINSGKLVQVQ